MRYAQIRDMDVVNAEGIGCSLFVQGCNRRCPGCFNPETWDFDGGKLWTDEIEDKFIQRCKSPQIDCVSILGGEPFEQGNDLYNLLSRIRKEVNKPIYVWTGYLYEDLIQMPELERFFTDGLIDALIDGCYDEEQRDLTLKFRGSKNQRILEITKGSSL